MREIVFEDDSVIVFVNYFEGNPIRFVLNKTNGELRMDAQAAARCLGFDSLNDMLSTDGALDVINEVKKECPDKPLFGAYGNGAMLETWE